MRARISSRRLGATIRRDVVLQNRYRFYAVSVVMVATWGGLLSLVVYAGQSHEALLVPAFVAANAVVTTFYFMGAMVLLEKTEGMLAAVVVTPLRDLEYLGSKIATLSVLALAETFLIVVIVFGWPARPLPLMAGALVVGALYVLAGFISVARYDSVNEWLMPSAVVVTLLSLPLVPHLGLSEPGIFRLHPVEPAYVMMRAAYAPAPGWELAYAVAGSVVWIALGTWWALRRFGMFVVRSAGEA